MAQESAAHDTYQSAADLLQMPVTSPPDGLISLVGGPIRFDYIGRLHRLIRPFLPTAKTITVLNPGGAADIATLLALTDGDDFVIPDRLAFEPTLTPARVIPSAVQRYLTHKFLYGLADGNALRLMGGIQPFLEAELLRLGASEIRPVKIPDYPGSYVIHFTWQGRARRIHYLAGVDGANVKAYEAYVRNVFGKVDILVLKAAEYSATFYRTEEIISDCLSDSGIFIADDVTALPSLKSFAQEFNVLHGLAVSVPELVEFEGKALDRYLLGYGKAIVMRRHAYGKRVSSQRYLRDIEPGVSNPNLEVDRVVRAAISRAADTVFYVYLPHIGSPEFWAEVQAHRSTVQRILADFFRERADILYAHDELNNELSADMDTLYNDARVTPLYHLKLTRERLKEFREAA